MDFLKWTPEQSKTFPMYIILSHKHPFTSIHYIHYALRNDPLMIENLWLRSIDHQCLIISHSYPHLSSIINYIYIYIYVVGGFKHLLFSIIYGMSSFPLIFICFKMVKTTNHIYIYISYEYHIDIPLEWKVAAPPSQFVHSQTPRLSTDPRSGGIFRGGLPLSEL